MPRSQRKSRAKIHLLRPGRFRLWDRLDCPEEMRTMCGLPLHIRYHIQLFPELSGSEAFHKSCRWRDEVNYHIPPEEFRSSSYLQKVQPDIVGAIPPADPRYEIFWNRSWSFRLLQIAKQFKDSTCSKCQFADRKEQCAVAPGRNYDDYSDDVVNRL